MKASPIFLDFFNREASRAAGRERGEQQDLHILRTLAISLPHTFSVNTSQLTEYCSTRPKLFQTTSSLIGVGIIDATTQAANLDDFIASRQKIYSHVPERYPFFFKDSEKLSHIRLGSRNTFDMSSSLEQRLLNYEPGSFAFDLGYRLICPQPYSD